MRPGDGEYPWVQIRRVAVPGTGHTPSRERAELWLEDECVIPWFTLADVWQIRDGDATVVTETTERISAAGLAASAAVLHPAGTALLSRTASVGFSAVMGVDMAVSQDYMTWTPGARLHGRFLLYVLRGLQQEFRRLMSGSTHKTIYMPDLLALRTPLPLVERQVAIAEFLDRECARIGDLRRVLSDHQRSTEELERRLIDDVFEGVPLTRLGWRAAVQTGLTLGGAYEQEDLVERPYLRVANVQADRIRTDDVHTVRVPARVAARTSLRTGDVLMTEGGDIDKLGRGAVWDGRISDCLHQNHVFAVRCGEQLLPELLAIWTRSSVARSYFERTASRITNIASTNLTKLLRLPIPDADVLTQRGILAEYNRRRSRVVELKALVEGVDRDLAEYRDALITEAVTGKLDVHRSSDRRMDESLHGTVEGSEPEVLSA